MLQWYHLLQVVLLEYQLLWQQSQWQEQLEEHHDAHSNHGSILLSDPLLQDNNIIIMYMY